MRGEIPRKQKRDNKQGKHKIDRVKGQGIMGWGAREEENGKFTKDS